MQSLVATQGKISDASRNALARVSAREFFSGDLDILSGPTGSFDVRKAMHFPISVTHLTASSCELGYRRSWTHIRANQVGLRVIWVLRRGVLQVVRSHGSQEVRAGQVTFIDSSVPFYARTRGDEWGEYESFQLVVPGHLFLRHLQEADRLAAPLDLVGPQAPMVGGILDLLARSGEKLSRRLAGTLAEGLLAALAGELDHQQAKISRHERLAAERLAEVSAYISANLSDSGLTFEQVARHFGISARYLCYVLKANGTSFSELLWQGRLEKAHALLLAASSSTQGSIADIARLSGFKSAAHFSRLFKAAFAVSPSQFRAANAGREPSDFEPATGDRKWQS